MKARTKGTIIRPGQRKAFKKANHEEIQKRVDFVEALISNRLRRGEIHKRTCKKFNVDWRTVDLDIGRARERILQNLRETKENHRCKALALYEQVIIEGTPREKTLAQERIDKLLGLEQPRTLSIGGIEGAPPIKTKEENPMKGLSVETLREIASWDSDEKKKKAS